MVCQKERELSLNTDTYKSIYSGTQTLQILNGSWAWMTMVKVDNKMYIRVPNN